MGIHRGNKRGRRNFYRPQFHRTKARRLQRSLVPAGVQVPGLHFRVCEGAKQVRTKHSRTQPLLQQQKISTLLSVSYFTDEIEREHSHPDDPADIVSGSVDEISWEYLFKAKQ